MSAITACQAGHHATLAPAEQWIDGLETAQHANARDDELKRLERLSLLVVDRSASGGDPAEAGATHSSWTGGGQSSALRSQRRALQARSVPAR